MVASIVQKKTIQEVKNHKKDLIKKKFKSKIESKIKEMKSDVDETAKDNMKNKIKSKIEEEEEIELEELENQHTSMEFQYYTIRLKTLICFIIQISAIPFLIKYEWEQGLK